MTTYTSKNGTISITDEVSGGYSSESKIPCNAKDRNREFKNVLLDCLNMTKRIVELEKDKINLIEEFAEAACLGEVAKIARQYGYEALKEPTL